MFVRSAVLFVVAALFEIGGAWLVWQGVREHRGWVWVGGGWSRSACTGSWRPCSRTPTSVGSSPPTAASSSPALLAWGMVADGYRPDRFDVAGR